MARICTNEFSKIYIYIYGNSNFPISSTRFWFLLFLIESPIVLFFSIEEVLPKSRSLDDGTGTWSKSSS